MSHRICSASRSNSKSVHPIVQIGLILGCAAVFCWLWCNSYLSVADVLISFPRDTSHTFRGSVPFSRASNAYTTDFLVTTRIYHYPTHNGLLRVRPDDCIQSLTVNGIDVAQVRQMRPETRCYPASPLLDLSPYLRSGWNDLQIAMRDVGGSYGIDLEGALLPEKSAFAFGSLWLALYLTPLTASSFGRRTRLLPVNLSGWKAPWMRGRLSVTDFVKWHAYCRLLAVPCAWLLVFLLSDWARGGRDQCMGLKLSPIPLAFLLWARLRGPAGLVRRRPSRLMWALSTVEFQIAWWDPAAPLSGVSATLAMLTGFFVFARPKPSLRQAFAEPRALLISGAVALALFAYKLISIILWRHLCRATGIVVAHILAFSDPGIAVINTPGVIILSAPHFQLRLFDGCSGIEGMFLFAFLLSTLLLFDWPLFRARDCLWLYLAGLLGVFFLNAIRITALFLLGVWAWRPDAGPLAIASRDLPLTLFHSFAGWALYLAAFAVFAMWLYRTSTSPGKQGSK